jgi:large subunit ribosomal protein L16
MKPRSRKFSKHHRYQIKLTPKYKNHLIYGNYGLMSNQSCLITSTQLSAAIMTLKRSLKRKGTLLTRVFPHIPVTAKPNETRMGKGKGSVNEWVTKVQNGSVLFELRSDSPLLAKTALMSVCKKLPFKTTFVSRISN